ncbi:Cellobiose phosphorylase [Thalassocella blandensis]|nr:Cellobiose phosphorylase [Thalassocella blandensis]
MTFGHFDDNQREFVITSPQTPYPWINFLGNSEFFSLISNTAGGYSFFKDAKFRRLTRYRYNNVPVDNGGKYFYINENGHVWSPSWKPVKTALDYYECRHGLGYTAFTSESRGLKCALTYFVPMQDPVELQKITLTNTTSEPKTFKLFSFVEWCLWNAEDDMTNFQRNFSTGEVEVEGSVIYHKTEYRERRNHFAYYAANTDICGFDSSRDAFLGHSNGFDSPAAVFNNTSQNSIAYGWAPAASHCVEVTLAAGESRTIIFSLGYVENAPDDKWQYKNVINKTKAKALIEKYSSEESVDQALEEVRRYWDKNLASFQLRSGEAPLDRMVNIWNQYQCMVTFHFSRSASFFESGIGRGMGFRDSNQDLIGILHMIPEKARERIIDIASTQFRDGSAYHQYQPLTKRGNAAIGGNFNDDPLWLILSITSYIKETGDYDILKESVPFNNDPEDSAPLFDHLTASFNHVVENLGPHKLPLIGRADWNDCLNLNCFSQDPNESFQTTEKSQGDVAESVLIAGMFVYFGSEYVALCREIDNQSEADRAATHIENMRQAVAQHGWDGQWFLRAYDSYGNKVGSESNTEGQIFIEPQGFCVMAGIGVDDGRAQSALDSVKEKLACEHGIVLVSPAYKAYQLHLGEITSYPPGYKENGGIFCHNNPWIMIAETKLGRGNEAFDYYRRLAPSYLGDNVALHKTEPYVYSQMVAGKEAPTPGEAKNSWLTGTAAWNYHAITEHILGVKPGYNGLELEPCLPDHLNKLEIVRQFRGATYTIDYVRCSPEKPRPEIHVDGQRLESNLLPCLTAGESCHVVVKI